MKNIFIQIIDNRKLCENKEEIIKKIIAYYLLLLSGEGCIFCKNNTCSIGVCAKHSTSGMPYVIQPGSNYEIMCELN